MMLVLGAMVLLLGLGSSLLFDGADGGGDDATAPVPTGTSTAGPETPEARAYPDDWYVDDVASPELVPVDVVGVIDGDTLDVEAGGTTLRVRAYGFDTPERGENCYDEARDRLAELVGKRVLLLADERLEDPGGRELRYLYTPDGLLIDAVMVAEGYAEAWRADGSLRSTLRGLEAEAREAKSGCLWSE